MRAGTSWAEMVVMVVAREGRKLLTRSRTPDRMCYS
jgi:hypothetical protein